ncbi:MAG: hypothetical protein DI620_02115 [Haemophilus parainfluenzae]|jgi:putative endoribonuclease L-PSP|nr:MAG: hypothetical protein DI620_02115 [Haemophilus parainfluenzae]
MTITSFTSKDAPEAKGPYSHAVKGCNLLFVSGQLGLNPKSGQLVEGGFKEEAKQAFANLHQVLKAANVSFAEVVKLTVFVTDLSHYSELNELLKNLLVTPYPARSVVQVAALPLNGQVEVEAIATFEGS